jgi:predicted amidohydrolase YtcJ
VTFGLHDDAPIAPPSPLLLANAAVNRINANGRLVGAPQRISVERALRAITIDAAYVLGAEVHSTQGKAAPGLFAQHAAWVNMAAASAWQRCSRRGYIQYRP